MDAKMTTIISNILIWFLSTVDANMDIQNPLSWKLFIAHFDRNRKWQDYVYIQCEYKSTKQKIKHLLREENKVKENKIS